MQTRWLLGGIAIGAALGAGAFWLVARRKTSALGQLVEATDPAIHLRQIRRYAFAASQDQSPVVGLTHASYALVLLDTLEEVMGRERVASAGVDVKALRKFITTQQDKHAEALQKCDPHLQEVLRIEAGEKQGRLPGIVLADVGAAPRGA